MGFAKFAKNFIMRVSSWFNNGHGSKILYYHDIFKTTDHKALDADIYMGTPLDLFRRHIDVIRSEGYEIVPHITNPKGQVAIMLDDGFRGIWECREFFLENNILPTVFLPAGFVGNVEKGLLSIEEILELQEQGVRFECHGWSHRPLNEFSDDELVHELVDSRNFLEQILHKSVTGLCMPLGFFSKHVLEKIQQAGYEEIYSCIPGNVSERPFGLIPRNLCQYATPQEIKLILRGGNEILKKRYSKMHCHG